MTTQAGTDRHDLTAVLSQGAKQVPLWVFFGLAMAPAVALGLSRFAYALLLPLMRAELGWSFADAGAISTANACGYLAGALVAAPLGKRAGDKRVFATGLLLTALVVGAMGLTADFRLLLLLRFIAGLAGAVAFVSGAGLTSAATGGDRKGRAALLLGIYFSGAGIGVIASALGVLPFLDMTGWRGGWFVLGLLSLVATLFGCWSLGRCPPNVRGPGGAGPVAWSPVFMARKLIAYGLYGAGYIAYATFIVAFLRNEQGFTDERITLFWCLVGAASVVGAFVWGPLLGRLRGGWGTAFTIGVVAIGAAVPLFFDGVFAAYVSALLFGGSFLAVIAAVTSFARKAVAPHALTSAVGALTIAFGLGQCIGPLLSGALADGASGVRNGLWLSVGILLVAGMVAAFQPEPPAQS
ncbi:MULTISPECIES: YbfB/YjiJ family MFS transporter [unclassified Pseudomonas]|uniref:YbfB/YjiJ family MFS transporter n=1 Tax=unclassified Pseudomonas TaxID=196821 RepID=UPI0015A2931C|nr:MULTISPECIES: YbfB/YjiJ family MFS transporter [unclassified Pseudomonas]NWC96597.1 YbfB/YjiJ family MFS transporter [Pseudomonas sp. IPO3779]NWD21176.1 YbfB/YjiJ family MFS transporter [Pseudomonas sp. IPO3778]